MKKILVPIDGSSASLSAAKSAVKDAKQNNGEIIFISVLRRPELMGRGSETGYGYAVNFESPIEDMIKNQTLMLNNALSAIDFTGIGYEKKILIGEPYEEILKFAEESKCNLIVMGRRGFSKIQRFFLGSVTQRVVSDAPCPVLVINEEE